MVVAAVATSTDVTGDSVVSASDVAVDAIVAEASEVSVVVVVATGLRLPAATTPES